jgi:phosphatidylglycerol:prolipoprotein diacylglycerol transferase
MHPILLQIAGFSVKTYGLFVATGFLAGIIFALREAKRKGYDPQQTLDLAFYIILGAIIGSRIFYVLTHFSYYSNNLLEIFKVWQGGLTFFGGFILSFLIGLWYTKRHQLVIWKTFDIFAPSIAIGEFFGRIGCFFAGCCYGKECTLPWAVTFSHPNSLATLGRQLHPTQLYASGAALLTFLVLFTFRKRVTFNGQLALMWLVLYSFFRLIIDSFRGDPRGDILFGQYYFSQIAAVFMIVFTLVLYPLLRKNERD